MRRGCWRIWRSHDRGTRRSKAEGAETRRQFDGDMEKSRRRDTEEAAKEKEIR